MAKSKHVKKAIAVHNPSNAWEQAIQTAAKHVTGSWLTAQDCQLLARAVALLKRDEEWLDNDELIKIRAYHLFSPQMTINKDEMVFVTHLLYLRDILENQQINTSLHSPITFVTIPLAHFLFRDCPVHIHINDSVLRSNNKKTSFVDVGGVCMVSDHDSVSLDGAILGINYKGDERKAAETQEVIDDVQKRSGVCFSKSAAHEIGNEVFGIEENYYNAYPGDRVLNKLLKSKGEITEVEPSETGFVRLTYDTGEEVSVNKEEFHEQFVVQNDAI